MSQELTVDDARQSMAGHVALKGAQLREKYGPAIGMEELNLVLRDRAFVRYPCGLKFDAAALQPGEFAYASPRGPRPEDGYVIFVHPHFMRRVDRVPWLVFYQLVAVNYGEFASAEDAEAFGAGALGITVEEYYQELCHLADEINCAGSSYRKV
jgi:hypothetical protein